MFKKIAIIAAMVCSTILVTGCEPDIESIKFRGTDLYYLPRKDTVTCKTGPNSFKKYFLGLSDNVTYFDEQMDSANVSTYHYRVIFKPQSIVPDIDFRANGSGLVR